MADPKILYAVVSVVFAALAVWLAFVFRSFKEPWAAVPVAAPATAKPAVAAATAEDEDEDEEDDEDESDEPEQVTVKNEAATEEAIEKAKKA